MKNFYTFSLLTMVFLTPFTSSGQQVENAVAANNNEYTLNYKHSVRLSVSYEALLDLNGYDDGTKPPFFDVSLRYLYKTGAYEVGIGPGFMYCPGNDDYYNALIGNLSLSNNIYLNRNKKTLTIWFLNVYKEVYYRNYESDYHETFIFEDANAYLMTGLAFRFGKDYQYLATIGFKETFEGYFEEWDASWLHFGVSYNLKIK